MTKKHLRCMATYLQAVHVLRLDNPFEHCKLCPYKAECNGLILETDVYMAHRIFYDMLKHLEEETGVFLGYETGL